MAGGLGPGWALVVGGAGAGAGAGESDDDGDDDDSDGDYDGDGVREEKLQRLSAL